MPVIQSILTPGRAHKGLTLEMLGGLRAEDRGGASLRNNLVAFWPCDEASGNLIDAHTNGLDITNYGLTTEPGHVYSTARHQEGSTTTAYRAHSPVLSAAGKDLTVASWFNFHGDKYNYILLLGKFNSRTVAASHEWSIYYRQGTGFLYFQTSDGSVFSIANANVGDIFGTGWHLVIGWHDELNGKNYTLFDNNVLGSASSVPTPQDAGNNFGVARVDTEAGYLEVGPVMVWQSLPGAGGVLTAEQREALWNYGAGLQYLDLAEALTPPPDWWFFYNRDAEAVYQPLGADDYPTSLLDLTANDNDIDDPWWQVTGITCLTAYQPVGAADYATSKINLANPGTYNAYEGTAPDWNSTDGWLFDKDESHYLKTGVLDTATQSMALRFTGALLELGQAFGTAFLSLHPYSSSTAGKRAYRHGNSSLLVGVPTSSGVMIITPTECFYNGGLEGSTPTPSALGRMVLLAASGANAAGDPEADRMTVNIQAFAIWDGDIADDAATITSAMASLPTTSPGANSPTWASGTGWTFDGVDDYLDTDLIPIAGSWSTFIQYANKTGGSDAALAISPGGTHWHSLGSVLRDGGSSGQSSSWGAAANLGVSDEVGYEDGVSLGALSSSPGSTVYSLLVGTGGDGAGGPGGFTALDVKALVLFPNTLPPEMAEELADRMAVVGVAYKLETLWTGNEIVGNRFDLVGGQLLTASGSPSSAEGHIYERARLYERIDLDYHSAPDSVALSMAGTDFTILAWVYLFDYDDDAYIIYKGGTNPTDREYDLGFVQSTSLLKFSVKGPIGVAKSVSATSYGAVPLNTWVHITAWYDDTAQTVSIQVDNGVVDSVSHTKGVRENMGNFYMSVNAALNAYWDGMIGPVSMLKSLLTEHERDALWNAGRGRKIRG